MEPHKENPAGQGGAPNTNEAGASNGSDNSESSRVLQGLVARRDFVLNQVRFAESLSAGEKRAFLMGSVGIFLSAIDEIDAAEPSRPIADPSAPVRGLLDMIATTNGGGEQ